MMKKDKKNKLEYLLWVLAILFVLNMIRGVIVEAIEFQDRANVEESWTADSEELEQYDYEKWLSNHMEQVEEQFNLWYRTPTNEVDEVAEFRELLVLLKEANEKEVPNDPEIEEMHNQYLDGLNSLDTAIDYILNVSVPYSESEREVAEYEATMEDIKNKLKE